MTTKLFIVDEFDREAQRQPGAVWEVSGYGPDGEHRQYAMDHLLSDEYQRDHAGRAPLNVRLPDGSVWPLDFHYTGSEGSGWAVTGDAPCLTARPSVNAAGSYHGWLTDGVLSDDLEGRTYP